MNKDNSGSSDTYHSILISDDENIKRLLKKRSADLAITSK